MQGQIGKGDATTSHKCKKCNVVFRVKETTKMPKHQKNGYCGYCKGGKGCQGCA